MIPEQASPDQIRSRIAPEVVGRELEVELILAAVDAGRDLLLEGPPGTSKTTLLKAVTAAWGVPLVLAEGSAELTPGRLLGHHDPARVLQEGYSHDTFEPGPLVEAMERGGFLYLEEFNRAPEDTLNALLTAIADRRVTIPRFGTVEALPTFRLIGSMNPYDTVGTTRLSVSIKDRLNRLVIDYQDAEAERQILRRRFTGAADGVPVTRLLADAVGLTRATRRHRKIVQGASVRGAIDLALIASQLCRARGIEEAGTDDYPDAVWEAMRLSLSGRISLDPSVDTDEEAVLREIWETAFSGDDWPEAVDLGLDESVLWPAGVLDLPVSTKAGADPADRANREFRVKPKQLDQDPDLSLGGGGAGLATLDAGRIGEDRKRRAGSSALTSEDGQLDDEEGERAGAPLDLEVRARALEIARRFQLRDAASIAGRTRGGLEIASLPYSGSGDDIDLDRTIDATAGERTLRSEEIFVRERRRTKRQLVLAVDVSGSTKGDGLLTAAATVGALSVRLHRDDLAIVAFWSDAAVLLRLGERAPLERILETMLSLDSRGLTNVSFPLEFAAEELGGFSGCEQRVLLLSDCVHNAGPDPRRAAARLPRLDVMFDVSGQRDSQLAAQIAAAGRGTVLAVRGYQDVAGALTRIFGSDALRRPARAAATSGQFKRIAGPIPDSSAPQLRSKAVSGSQRRHNDDTR